MLYNYKNLELVQVSAGKKITFPRALITDSASVTNSPKGMITERKKSIYIPSSESMDIEVGKDYFLIDNKKFTAQSVDYRYYGGINYHHFLAVSGK